MAALRAIAAGNFTRVGPIGMQADIPSEFVDDMRRAPTCVDPACEKPLREGSGKMAGKWSCADMACGMYGKVQPGKR